MTEMSKVDWATPYDEWLIPILNNYRYSGAIICRAIPSEIQTHIEALIQQEQLALLDRILTEVVGENHVLYGHGEDWEGAEPQNDLKDEMRTHLNSIKEELNHE